MCNTKFWHKENIHFSKYFKFIYLKFLFTSKSTKEDSADKTELLQMEDTNENAMMKRLYTYIQKGCVFTHRHERQKILKLIYTNMK